MKANTTREYHYIGDYYSYTIVTSADGTVSNRVYETTPVKVSLAISLNLLGELVIISNSKMQLDGYIKNLLDRNGDQIYDGGVWQINQTAPLLNGLGLKDGYKYRAKLIEGMI